MESVPSSVHEREETKGNERQQKHVVRERAAECISEAGARTTRQVNNMADKHHHSDGLPRSGE